MEGVLSAVSAMCIAGLSPPTLVAIVHLVRELIC